MALPFDRLNPADRQILDSLKAQTENLRGQTKVLHSLSAEIIKLRKDANSTSSKTSKEFQNLFSKIGGGFSEIKSYLRAEGGIKKSSTASMPDKGFFSNIFNKMFGPSKYQTKVMEEITLLRDLSERQTRHLEFIAEQNTDSKRAKEREALATAIVNKMKMLDLGGDGGGLGGSIMSTLGKALLAGIGGAIALLGRQITTALRGLLAGIKLAFMGLKDLFKTLFPKIPPTAGPVPGQGPASTPGAPGGLPPVVSQPGGAPPDNRRLPGPNNPRLPPPAADGRSGGFNRQGPGFKQSWKGMNQPPSDAGSRFSPGGGRAIALALVALGAALGFKLTLGDEEPAGSILGGSVFDTDPTDKLLRDIDQRYEMKRQGVEPRDEMALGEALQIAGKDKFFTDPYTGQQITAEQFKKRYQDKLKPEEKKELDKFIDTEKLEEERLKKEREKLEQEEKGLDLQEDFNSIIQSSINALDGLTDAVSQISLEGVKNKIVPFLNQLGEISIGGQSINLAPGLGNAMAKSLDQSITLGKELAEYTAEQFTSKNNTSPISVINNTNNNVNNSTSSLPPATAKRPPGEDPLLQMWGFTK